LAEPTRILVTGAAGFIGHHVIEAAAKAGMTVIPMIRRPPVPESLGSFEGAVRYADLRDEKALAGAVRDVDVIVHLGGLTRARNEAEFMATNAEGVARLARAARVHAPGLRRLVYVSSLSAGGPSEPAAPISEERAASPVSAYGRSKLAGEAALVREAGSLAWTIIRPPIVYGPKERDLHRMFLMARLGIVPIVGFRERRYSVVHAADLASGVLAVLGSERSIGQTYYVAEDRTYSGRELAAIVAGSIGKTPFMIRVPDWFAGAVAGWGSLLKLVARRSPLVTLDKYPEIVRSWVCSPAKIERECGFRCTIPFDAGIAETAAWYREHGWL
jgi:nucleoside-diphosphate-sugar epimerase